MKIFLSIGTGPGIGLETAERFAREGYRIVLAARDNSKLSELAKTMSSKGYQVIARPVDASDLGSVTTLLKEIEAQFETIDVLHFNAASMRAATIDQQDASSFVYDLTVNIAAALVAVQVVSRGMLDRRSGSILMTGGGLAVQPAPNYLSLSIGKAGVRTLANALFAPFQENNVHIASVTVATNVAANSPESQGVAETFWALHNAPRSEWVSEVTYPEPVV